MSATSVPVISNDPSEIEHAVEQSLLLLRQRPEAEKCW